MSFFSAEGWKSSAFSSHQVFFSVRVYICKCLQASLYAVVVDLVLLVCKIRWSASSLVLMSSKSSESSGSLPFHAFTGCDTTSLCCKSSGRNRIVIPESYRIKTKWRQTISAARPAHRKGRFVVYTWLLDKCHCSGYAQKWFLFVSKQISSLVTQLSMCNMQFSALEREHLMLESREIFWFRSICQKYTLYVRFIYSHSLDISLASCICICMSIGLILWTKSRCVLFCFSPIIPVL